LPRKHAINETFFDTWSHDMAYIMGFFIADGNVSKNKYTINFTLHEKDIEFLHYVNCTMGSGYEIKRIKNKEQYAYLSISSIAIVASLAKYGILPNKRETWHGVNFDIPPQYIPDFVRGFFDGDGWVCNCASTGYCQTGFANKSKRFLKQIKSMTGLLGGSLTERTSWYQLTFSHGNSLRLRDFMYNGNFALERKRDKLNAQLPLPLL